MSQSSLPTADPHIDGTCFSQANKILADGGSRYYVTADRIDRATGKLSHAGMAGVYNVGAGQ